MKRVRAIYPVPLTGTLRPPRTPGGTPFLVSSAYDRQSLATQRSESEMDRSIRATTLHIESNASCQLRCPTCPTTSKGYPPAVGSGYLKLKDLQRLLEKNPRINEIYLENRGELFLNRELLSILEYVYRQGVELYCTSGVNLNTVGEGVLEGLVKYQMRGLLCSIDGATPEVYARYRRRGDLNNVLDHIRTINAYKEQYSSEYPRLTWQFVVFGHNEHEIPASRSLARGLNMDFVTKMSWDSDYSPIRDPEFVMRETGWPAVTREEYERITDKNYSRGVCTALWYSPRVNWDGRILGCCWNSWGDFGGNAFTDGYDQSCNNAIISRSRRMLLGEAEPIDESPCASCSLYLDMRKTGNYLLLDEVYDRKPLWYRGARWVYKDLGLKKRWHRIRRGMSGNRLI